MCLQQGLLFHKNEFLYEYNIGRLPIQKMKGLQVMNGRLSCSLLLQPSKAVLQPNTIWALPCSGQRLLKCQAGKYSCPKLFTHHHCELSQILSTSPASCSLKRKTDICKYQLACFCFLAAACSTMSIWTVTKTCRMKLAYEMFLRSGEFLPFGQTDAGLVVWNGLKHHLPEGGHSPSLNQEVVQ